MKKVIATILCAIMVLSMAACGNNSDESSVVSVDTSDSSTDSYDTIEWPTSGLGAMLPVPEDGVCEINEDNDEEFSAFIEEISSDGFAAYVDACKDAGFTINSIDYDSYYAAGCEGGYDLSMSYDEDDESMYIFLEAPYKMEDIIWPTIGLAASLPIPDSMIGWIEDDDSTQFLAYIACDSKSEYNTYVTACQEAGYIVDYMKDDDLFMADNESGYSLSITYYDYKGYYEIYLYDLSGYDYDDEFTDTAETEAAETAEETIAPETADTETEETASNEAAADSSEELVDGMRPSFKEAMDSYETFYDEYCEFMKEYIDNPTDPAYLTRYAELIDKAAEMDEKFEAWDEDEMNDAELKYYLEVNNRVIQKLLEVSQ